MRSWQCHYYVLRTVKKHARTVANDPSWHSELNKGLLIPIHRVLLFLYGAEHRTSGNCRIIPESDISPTRFRRGDPPIHKPKKKKKTQPNVSVRWMRRGARNLPNQEIRGNPWRVPDQNRGYDNPLLLDLYNLVFSEFPYTAYTHRINCDGYLLRAWFLHGMGPLGLECFMIMMMTERVLCTSNSRMKSPAIWLLVSLYCVYWSRSMLLYDRKLSRSRNFVFSTPPIVIYQKK